MSRVAVLGAGSGGLAATVELVRAGHTVSLWNRNPATLEPVRRWGAVRYLGVMGAGEASPNWIGTDLGAALDGAEVAVTCLPALAHETLFVDLAGIGCSIPVVLNPGHTCGALHARATFMERGCRLPPLAELSTLTYVARAGEGSVSIAGRARAVRAGCLPGGEEALDWACRLFPAVEPVADVIASSLANVNLVLHPPGAILAAAWVEATGGDFTFYVEGMTPSVGRVLGALDEERRAVAGGYGHELPSLVEEMSRIGTVEVGAAARRDVLAAIRSGEPNREIKAPSSLQHRYYREDLPFGLLPMLVLAEIAGVATPTARALLHIGAVALGEDVWETGLNRRRLGLDGCDLADLVTLIRGPQQGAAL